MHKKQRPYHGKNKGIFRIDIADNHHSCDNVSVDTTCADGLIVVVPYRRVANNRGNGAVHAWCGHVHDADRQPHRHDSYEVEKPATYFVCELYSGRCDHDCGADLQVLAETVPHIDAKVLLITVGVGVGLFLAVCMLRTILGIRLKWLILAFYIIVFVLAAFADKNFLSIAFDSGGVTTGPMTVPFILALGIGVANIRSDKKAEADSFGLVALCSIGPVLAVLILGLFYKGQGVADVNLPFIPETTTEMGLEYLKAFPAYMKEMAIALSPIIVLFLIFQVAAFKMSKKSFLKTLIGILYTYVGLVLFLTGVNVGFSPLGLYLGQQLYSGWTQYILIPVAMLMGWFIISAEPAVFVLEKQIEDVSSGAIPGKAIKLSLSIAIALAMGLSMIRVLTGISILWFIVPGYLVALILMFFVPDIFTAIAFDSGGVASGPMTATFMLQFFIGVCSARGGNILSDAFGAVALVAMMPLISIQITGLVYKKKKQRAERVAEVVYGDDDIIELWGN